MLFGQTSSTKGDLLIVDLFQLLRDSNVWDIFHRETLKDRLDTR